AWALKASRSELDTRRAIKGMLGPMKSILWTDHANLTRTQHRSLSGRSAKFADGLVGQLRGFSCWEYLDDEAEEVAVADEGSRSRSDLEGTVCAGGYCRPEQRMTMTSSLMRRLRDSFGENVKAKLTGRKLANATRVDRFTSAVKVLRDVAFHKSAFATGEGQGGAVVAVLAKPVAVESVLLARYVKAEQGRDIALSWSAVKLLVAERPRLGTAKPGGDLLLEACPELLEPCPVTDLPLLVTPEPQIPELTVSGLRELFSAPEPLPRRKAVLDVKTFVNPKWPITLYAKDWRRSVGDESWKANWERLSYHLDALSDVGRDRGTFDGREDRTRETSSLLFHFLTHYFPVHTVHWERVEGDPSVETCHGPWFEKSEEG
ncbi:pol, partial [Symbiodinium necroappetens]